MTEIEKVQRNIEIGYTMAVYGTHENLHKQMLTDIETLIEQIKQGSKLPMHDVSGSLPCGKAACKYELSETERACDFCNDRIKTNSH
jgi:hypothetical protein